MLATRVIAGVSMHHLAILIKLEDYSIYIIETLIGNISFISWEHFASTSYKLISMHYTEVYIATYCSQLYSLVDPSVDHEEVVPILHHLMCVCIKKKNACR